MYIFSAYFKIGRLFFIHSLFITSTTELAAASNQNSKLLTEKEYREQH